MFDQIPSTIPSTPLLDKIETPNELRLLAEADLPQLAKELREYLLYCVGQSGGHFGAGLGVVELTVALHYLYNTPEDRLIWDVGHQAYPHKILTGRRGRMTSMRQKGGLTAFPSRTESPYDAFGVGHSSTSISAALGMALAARQLGAKRKIAAVIGDGALTAGMAFEALHHAAHTKADILVILNDNDMSISRNVGGLSNYLAKILTSKVYHNVREGGKKVLSNLPGALEMARRTEEHMKGMVVPGTLFEEMGFNYIGPIDGHDLDILIPTIGKMMELSGPQFLHIITKKGKDFKPAEDDPVGYHAINKLEPKPALELAIPKISSPKYSNVFGEWICDMAQQDERLVGITPAMEEGSGLTRFAQEFPERYYDVAIAEQHAVTLAAGLACESLKPVVAIYSTFLQRAYDQLIHDVALQNLDILFAIDRAGLVGQDGPTHAGSFDLTYLRCVPNMLIMAPADENETRQMLYTGYLYQGPAAVRYPRGTGPGVAIEKKMRALAIGKGELRREGQDVAILCFGTLLAQALEAADELNATVANMRFVKPLDEALVIRLAQEHDLLVTLEENSLLGGAGSAINELVAAKHLKISLLNLGLPDRFVDHGKPYEMLAECGLDKSGILAAIQARLCTDKKENPTKGAVRPAKTVS
ncbi:MAG: 1-deoxy-D-xylulose-5-phosphate synthase [Pseudomonadales bacterium]|nr:1-deoxy-D-xylulose-5-phosphate synthase [Pseudomonadales bacterium]MCP5213736.1 1-deoxy-D-xylulose-5-phosphate synthase [Pseudomonadales bacterium]